MDAIYFNISETNKKKFHTAVLFGTSICVLLKLRQENANKTKQIMILHSIPHVVHFSRIYRVAWTFFFIYSSIILLSRVDLPSSACMTYNAWFNTSFLTYLLYYISYAFILY